MGDYRDSRGEHRIIISNLQDDDERKDVITVFTCHACGEHFCVTYGPGMHKCKNENADAAGYEIW